MYQALYRKYRPKTFRDVIGQPQVTTTLQNELLSGRISHAYLFIGSRGTGKTTCAKILAKAVNCLNPRNGNPCGECEICRQIDSEEILDIVELDAASNNGVNDIREICESAAFTPAQSKYRVYIVDEVHMLSAGAFNALLKTLEEPPNYVIFILATTEMHKIPATILSRCQRFEFHKISVDDIANRIEYVSEKEKVNIERGAARLIAKVSDGAMRDALAILDKCMGQSKKITMADVTEIVGVASQDQILNLMQFVVKGLPQDALKLIDNFDKASKDMLRLTFELLCAFRNLMLIKTLKNNAENLVVVSEDEYKKLYEIAQALTLESIIFIMDTLQLSFEKMSKGCNAKIELEMCLIKLCDPKLNYSKEAIVNRLEKLEKKFDMLSLNAEGKKKDAKTDLKDSPEKNIAENQKLSEELIKSSEKKLEYNLEVVTLQKNAQKMLNWPEVLKILNEYSHTIATAFKDSKAYVSGDFVLIDSDNEMAFELLRKSSQRDKMRTAIKNITGKAYKLGPYLKPKENDDSENVDPLTELAENARQMGINVTER